MYKSQEQTIVNFFIGYFEPTLSYIYRKGRYPAGRVVLSKHIIYGQWPVIPNMTQLPQNERASFFATLGHTAQWVELLHTFLIGKIECKNQSRKFLPRLILIYPLIISVFRNQIFLVVNKMHVCIALSYSLLIDDKHGGWCL